MWTALRFTLITFLISGILYPLFITAMGQLLFPIQANGSLIHNLKGDVIGSELIGQNFTHDIYFHPRPSFSQYDASSSGGFNDGPTSRKLLARAQQIADQKDAEGYPTMIPGDAVLASGSGLDPHISLANALDQVPRIASARHCAIMGVDQTSGSSQHVEPDGTVKNCSDESLKKLVLAMSENGLGTASYVNVLRLNLALDRQR
jgi:K+-transporting ATPase ATPase C chain